MALDDLYFTFTLIVIVLPFTLAVNLPLPMLRASMYKDIAVNKIFSQYLGKDHSYGTLPGCGHAYQYDILLYGIDRFQVHSFAQLTFNVGHIIDMPHTVLPIITHTHM